MKFTDEEIQRVIEYFRKEYPDQLTKKQALEVKCKVDKYIDLKRKQMKRKLREMPNAGEIVIKELQAKGKEEVPY